MDTDQLKELAKMVSASIGAAQRTLERSPAADRSLRRLLALLWSAQDELDGLAPRGRRSNG